MATKSSIFSSIISRSPMITSEKLVSSKNYLSWSASVELWFMGQGYEDHFVTQEVDIPEKFLTVMPLTTDVGDQRTRIDKFFMVLTLIGLRPNLETTLPSDNTSNSSVLVSQTNSRGGHSGNRGRGQRPHCTYCNKLGHTRDRCYQLHGRPPRIAHVAQVFPSLTVNMMTISAIRPPSHFCCPNGNTSACLTHTSSLGPWILDSGASDHISGNKDLFSSITTTSALPTITLANGSQTVAKGIGLAHPLPSLPLTYVLYTPECSFNLISMSKITHTLNCSITFSDKFVTLQDRSTGKTIGIGCESQGLYHLTSPSTPVKMVSHFSSLSSLACESCQLGKHTHVSFPKRLNNRAKSPFELVHTDVWGPCRTASTLGFQYFVTFIDDYSRCTCNNAREYFSAPFTSFMSQHGILHQSSSERKNRHLVETACTLLLHSNVPFRFWGDVVLTACYLINRMPSSVLHDQILHSLLFPEQPLYFLPPRVFGYTCFVHILTPGQDKLSGYRCYSSKTHCYFLSADVTFFEDSPFFSTSESLPVSEVLPLPIISPHDAVPSHPLQVYHRRHHVAVPPSLAKVPADSLPIPLASPAPALPPSANLPIALRKGWRQAMVDEMAALHSNGTWDLVVLPSGKSTVGCRWVYIKVGHDGRSLYGATTWFCCSGGVWFSAQVMPFSIWLETISSSICIYLVVYVDDIVITGSDQNDSSIQFRCGSFPKEVCFRHLGRNRYGELLGDPWRYWRLVGKLNYLTITRPDISFPMSVVSQFLQSPCDSHWDVVIRILRYIKSTPSQGVLYENRGHTQVVGYTNADWVGSPTIVVPLRVLCFIRGNLISGRMKLICDNQAALHIASNPVFHERTKHVEVDCHFIREKIASGCVTTSFVNSNDQLTDIFTKSLKSPRIKYICNKLGAYNIYAPA
ncbi:hypothetical protein AAG906_039164 [Vitis piasezkii]